MRRASLNRARNLCLGVLLLAAIASGSGIGSKGEAAVAHPTASPATFDVPLTATGQPEIYFVPDVVGQFDKLARRPDGSAFGIGNSPDPTLFKHYQGLARTHGPGAPYLFVSRSGNDTQCVDCENDLGNLLIVRMGSRDASGERFRTNRLIRDWLPYVRDSNGEPVRDSGGNPVPWTKPPDPRDTTVAHITFSGENGWPRYGHPGGMQLVGDVLAVPLEAPYNEGDSANLILFLDVSNPESPEIVSGFQPLPGSNYKAGLVGLTPVLNPLGAGVRYLMITTGGNNHDVRLYRSLPTDPDGSTNLKSENLYWEFLRSINKDAIEGCSGGAEWPEGNGAYQSLNFVRQESLNGPLFVVGARNTVAGGAGSDFLDLYEVKVDPYGNPEDCMLKRRRSMHVSSYPFNGHGDSANFAAASGTYVSPSGELIVYGTEYENDGPYELLPNGQPGRKTVRFGEWRHHEMVRPDSPTLRPTVELSGPFEVNEGSAAAIAGQGKGPITKAWIQLFEDDGAGSSLPDFAGDDDWLAVDYEDWGKDNFDDFSQFDARTGTDFNNNAGSWRWFAPPGCTLRANQDQFFATTGVFPGSHTKTLYGDGAVHEKSDLDAVPSDDGAHFMDDVISSVQFFKTPEVNYPFPDCRDYYNAPVSVAWDLDLDGSYETTGSPVTFNAAALDGPAVVNVPAQARHPSGGPAGQATAKVTVRNVAPQLAPLLVTDGTGRRVNVDVPFVLMNLPVTVGASFGDPGVLDRQTATLAWGDGTAEAQSAFTSFDEAFGDATGSASHGHRYRLAGSYTIALSVVDDDGGAGVETATLRVLTPEQAVEEIIRMLDVVIAGTTNDGVREELGLARKALAGSNDHSSNGALDMIRAGNEQAAVAFLWQSIDRLRRAEAGGADVATHIALLEQVVAGMSAA